MAKKLFIIDTKYGVCQMKILNNKEIYSLVTRPFEQSNVGLNIKPFDLNSLNFESYTLHAGSHIVTHHQRGNQRNTLDKKNGLLVSPNLIYTIEILERIETRNLTTSVYGTGITNCSHIGKQGDILAVRFSPLVPMFIYLGDNIGEIKFILIDDRQKIDVNEHSKGIVEKLGNAPQTLTIPSRINVPEHVRER